MFRFVILIILCAMPVMSAPAPFPNFSKKNILVGVWKENSETYTGTTTFLLNGDFKYNTTDESIGCRGTWHYNRNENVLTVNIKKQIYLNVCWKNYNPSYTYNIEISNYSKDKIEGYDREHNCNVTFTKQ